MYIDMKHPFIDINIDKNKVGWLDLHINNTHLSISYLNDFIGEMCKILNTPFYSNNTEQIYFDCEGTDVYIKFHLEKRDIVLHINESKDDITTTHVYKFDFREFRESFQQSFNKVIHKYYKYFEVD